MHTLKLVDVGTNSHTSCECWRQHLSIGADQGLEIICCPQMEKRAAQAGAAGVQSRVELVRASPHRRALSLAEEHVALEPATMSINFKPLSRSQALLKRG